MERGSDKHGPLLDDQLKEETEALVRGEPVPSHVEEFRQVEELDAEETGGASPDRPADAS